MSLHSVALLPLTLALGCAGAETTEPAEPAAPPEPSAPPESPRSPPAEPPPATDPPESPRPAPPAEPYPVGGDVLAPKRLEGPRSRQLDELFHGGHYAWGACILRAVITREGKVDEIELLKPRAVAPEVESALYDLFNALRFQPATRRGEPVAVRFHFTIYHCPLWRRDQPPESDDR